MCTPIVVLLLAACTAALAKDAEISPSVELREIFTAGEPNAHGFPVNSYRIPGFLSLGNGTLLVVAEARLYSCNDKTPHDLVSKRSTDDGLTWGKSTMVVEPSVLWGPGEGGKDGGATYDPTPVLDSKGVVHVLFSYCPARYMTRPPIPQAFELWEVTTADAGLSWSIPKNLSNTVPPLRHGEREWIVRTGGGGGNGIRIQEGKHAGRLLVPGYHNYPPTAASHAPTQLPPSLSAKGGWAGECIKPQGEALATQWCNDAVHGPGCTANPGPLLALQSGSKGQPSALEWRCYSPSSLTKDKTSYNASAGSPEYCTYDAEIASIVASCKYPPPPPPPPPPYAESYSYVMISDDDGESWRFSESFFQDSGEGSLAEVSADRLIFVARRTSATHCVDPAIRHCAGRMLSVDGGETWSDEVDVGQLPDPACKNTVASWPEKGLLVHGGSHSDASRTNVSALFSSDGGKTWDGEVMVWESPNIGGYTAAQAWGETVGIVFENHTCSISIGIIV